MTISQRRKKLEEMARGNGLSDAYRTTLTRLKGQKGNKSALGMKVLMWVVYSERPILGEELCHALGVEIGSTHLDSKNIPVLRTLISSCVGLVTVERHSSTVRLVHFTLQEYLLSNLTLFRNPHAELAEVCLTYLNFGSVCDLSPTLDSAPLTMPLLEYASYYWGKHAGIGMAENIKTLALRLLDKFDEHISAQLLLVRRKRRDPWDLCFDEEEGPTGFTGLHGASFHGVAEILVCILERNRWDVNSTDCCGRTALIWAAESGNEEVVRTLLEREDINPDQAETEYSRTPLQLAAQDGHEGVVKMLLERQDVNPGHIDTFYGHTPLLSAVRAGHGGAVKILLERADVNPN